ncbi:MAG TPA: dihydrolipoamide acetyltransferase family protein [Chloroflexia bacterium]|nr:dihydrolipoamide acetyltransferase family protein [Chloroflexia bacterium]
MATKITMPMLGEGAHEGTIGTWLKKVGDHVEEYEPIVEVITDKVNAEVPAPMTGILSSILVKEGETVEVGAVLGEMTPVGAEKSSSLGSVITSESAHQQPAQPELEAAFAQPKTNQAAEMNKAVDAAAEEVEASFPNGRASGGWYEDEEEDTFGGVSAPTAPLDGKGRKPNRYSPAVRRLAEEHHLDLDRLGLRGSGIGGRITRDDVLMYIEQQRLLQQPVPTRALPREEAAYTPPPPVPSMHEQMAANAMREQNQSQMAVPAQPATPTPPARPVPAPAPAAPAQPAPNFSEAVVAGYSANGGDEVVPLTPMRRAIAEHMVRSVQTSPHAWTMVEVDMTRLVRHRAAMKEEFKRREGVDLTYLPFIMKAVIDGLRQFPMMNASWAADGSGVIMKRDLNIGVAIDVPDGLVVPVLHRADEKSLVGLARALNDLITRARNKKLSMADVQGGTFTVNNPGAFGSVMSQPILNQPQAGIVTMEAIVKRPVVLTDAEGNDNVVVRSMMNMCISFDHRVVDGATAGRFLQFIKKWLETRDYNAGF